jgi:hypothetical protein
MSNSKYQAIATKVRKAFKSHNKELLNESLKEMFDQFIIYQGLIEVKGKKSCPVSERYLEVLTVESSSSKLTINPTDGRCTLKVSDKASEGVIASCIELARELMKAELPPVTLRGKIKYYKSGYECSLSSESGKNKFKVRIEENFNE